MWVPNMELKRAKGLRMAKGDWHWQTHLQQNLSSPGLFLSCAFMRVPNMELQQAEGLRMAKGGLALANAVTIRMSSSPGPFLSCAIYVGPKHGASAG